MNELTQEQIAQVARIVTRWKHTIEKWESDCDVPTVVIMGPLESWKPDFDAQGDRTYKACKRSQALAIVEWLFDKTDPLPNAAAMRDRIGRLVHLRNTTALQAMVLELSEKS